MDVDKMNKSILPLILGVSGRPLSGGRINKIKVWKLEEKTLSLAIGHVLLISFLHINAINVYVMWICD